MNDPKSYQSPLSSRYPSAAMRENFSPHKKFTTWRRLWLALAECEKELGLDITGEQLDELRAHLEDIDYELAARYERELRHDVMAHVHAYGEQCPKARGILHLGATSCFVTDNAELIVLRDGLRILRDQLVNTIRNLAAFAREWKSLPVLGLTHYQPAQATTLGKRACLWLQDLVFNLEDLEHAESQIRFRGVKGTTGSQASFLSLFDGDHAKVRELDERVTERMGFERRFLVTGQTYPRQLDFRVCQVLSGIAQSASKFAVDLRLAAGRREIEEPFEAKQIGSSAMPWKRNPMRSERICALARHVIAGLDNAAHTAANQWFERTLDDSANRRLAISESFLATDSILQLYLNVSAGIVVHAPVIERHLREELPFLASEHLLMEAVRAGIDRQDGHERIRVLARQASDAIHAGESNPMRDLLASDPLFEPLAGHLDRLLDPARFVGRAPEQVEEFLAEGVEPVLERYAQVPAAGGDVRV
ncbi:MAG TPA: adenylosuccinate lyase [Planctomycetes bacterium]|nr:adenylosuccinate lyase [Planctomycetota bacterium]